MLGLRLPPISDTSAPSLIVDSWVKMLYHSMCIFQLLAGGRIHVPGNMGSVLYPSFLSSGFTNFILLSQANAHCVVRCITEAPLLLSRTVIKGPSYTGFSNYFPFNNGFALFFLNFPASA